MKNQEQKEMLIAENAKYVKRYYVGKHNQNGNNNNAAAFHQSRTLFVKALEKDGYHTFVNGNYITATRNDETNVFYFTAHGRNLHNYLLAVKLQQFVNYFAFYDIINNCVYKVSYSKVKAYCDNINVVASFYGKSKKTDLKILVPDTWANQQRINTYFV